MDDLYSRFYTRISKNGVKTAILMSGGGSNARNILTQRHLYPKVDICLVVTDRRNSNALQIAKEFGLAFLCVEGSIKTNRLRANYFNKLAKKLRDMDIEIILYAGYMKIVTNKFLVEFPGINSHPSDLRIMGRNNKRKYVGMDAIKLTIDDGQKEIRCSCFVVEKNVDEGKLIAVSSPIGISDNMAPSEVHSKLKYNEWKYYPKVIQKLANKELTAISSIYVFDE